MLKRRYLRIVAGFKNKKKQNIVEKLTEEQKLIYNITLKLLASPNSILESDYKNGIFYIKNDLKLIKIEGNSISFVNGKFSYFFSYDYEIIQDLKEVFYRHKQMDLNRLLGEISNGTTANLRNIYSELIKK